MANVRVIAYDNITTTMMQTTTLTTMTRTTTIRIPNKQKTKVKFTVGLKIDSVSVKLGWKQNAGTDWIESGLPWLSYRFWRQWMKIDVWNDLSRTWRNNSYCLSSWIVVVERNATVCSYKASKMPANIHVKMYWHHREEHVVRRPKKRRMIMETTPYFK